MSRVVVVGAGLFGSIIAAELRHQGHNVTVISDQRPNMGSLPAACLMKPSWAANMKGKAWDDALELLDRHYGVQELQFDVPPFRGMVPVYWVDPSKVLRQPDIDAVMTSYDPREVSFIHIGRAGLAGSRSTLEYDHLVLATGSWAMQADRSLEGRLKAQGGWAFLVEGQLNRGFIKPWAPYKQLVAFNINPLQVWVGDGSALLPESMTPERERLSRARCIEALGQTGLGYLDSDEVVVKKGFRPKVVGLKEPAYLNHVGPRHTVVTGGAKNGTLGAAWAARKIAEQLQ